MSASGCASKCVASSASRSPIWRFSSAMMPTAARVLAPKAAVTVVGAASCGVRSAAWMCCARVSRLRWRPAVLSAARIVDKLRRPGVDGGRGATQDGQRIAVGQIVERLQRRWVVFAQRRAQTVGVTGACPDQILVCAASTLIASTASLSPAIRRWLCRSVRTRSASNLASEASDLAPEMW
jgi:hypothetical protein